MISIVNQIIVDNRDYGIFLNVLSVKTGDASK
jgi:hypothetical protein